MDTYTARVMVRHGLIGPDLDYQQLQDLFMSNLEPDAALFNEFHALLVMTGKDYCKPHPKCHPAPSNACPTGPTSSTPEQRTEDRGLMMAQSFAFGWSHHMDEWSTCVGAIEMIR